MKISNNAFGNPYRVIVTLCAIGLSSLYPRIAVYAQVAKTGPTAGRIAEDIDRINKGYADPATVEEIASAHASNAVPAVKAEFARSQDRKEKFRLASALVRLGEKDQTYWKYLSDEATEAAESEIPDPVYDTEGNSTPHEFPTTFVRWAKDNNMTPNDAAMQALQELPVRMLLLGKTGDPRAIPILRKALQSSNFMISATAATSLAALQDKDSIPLIIDACRRAPASASPAIATALVYFDDPEARRAVDTYMPKDGAKIAREARSRGRTPFGF